jgi:hypothetical protein
MLSAPCQFCFRICYYEYLKETLGGSTLNMTYQRTFCVFYFNFLEDLNTIKKNIVHWLVAAKDTGLEVNTEQGK